MKINLKKYCYCLGPIIHKKNIKNQSLPIVATPIVAYYIGESQDSYKKEIENFFRRKNLIMPKDIHPHMDTKTGYDSASQDKIKKALKKACERGEISESECQKFSSKVAFTGAPDHDLYEHKPADFDTELSSIDREISSLDLEQSQLSLNMDSMSEAIDTGMLDDTELSGLLDHLADHPGAIAATGLAAEFLPGTRFAKPVVDLFKGEFKKAA